MHSLRNHGSYSIRSHSSLHTRMQALWKRSGTWDRKGKNSTRWSWPLQESGVPLSCVTMCHGWASSPSCKLGWPRLLRNLRNSTRSIATRLFDLNARELQRTADSGIREGDVEIRWCIPLVMIIIAVMMAPGRTSPFIGWNPSELWHGGLHASVYNTFFTIGQGD